MLPDSPGSMMRRKQLIPVSAKTQSGRSYLQRHTWYSLNDQVDWDSALREDNGNVNALGLFDLDRKIRPAGKAYKKIIEQWAPVLEKEPLGLKL